MTPEEHAETDAAPPRRQRGSVHTDSQRVMPRGGIGADCGCRYARTSGQWQHITPCRSHPLALFPIADERMQELTSA